MRPASHSQRGPTSAKRVNRQVRAVLTQGEQVSPGRRQNLVKCSKHSLAVSMSANSAASERFTAR